MNVEELQDIVGKDWVITDRKQMQSYLIDETVEFARPKAAANIIVVKPANSEEISRILKLANREKIPVFPRGAGTGLVGGAIPTKDGVVLSLERLDKVEEVDKENLMIVAQAGVTTEKLMKAAGDAGLFFPPHPGDEGAQVGGIVACNAGGSRAVKHGVIRAYVKGFQLVLPTGEIVNMGGKLLKNNTGYALMHLLMGSEGTLGVITKVIFRLYPKPPNSATLVISYNDLYDAINTVPKILQQGIIPLAIEYVGRKEIVMSAEHLGMNWPAKKGSDYLIIIVEGASIDALYSECEQISDICQEYNAVDTLIAERRGEQDEILKIRSGLFTPLKPKMADDVDVVVPPASIGDLMRAIGKLEEQFDTSIPTYGHAGDGNLHVHLMMDLVDKGTLTTVKRELFKEAAKLGGMITGEHGVGKIRISDLGLCLDAKTREVMKGIKGVFDPNNILNPDTVIG